MASAIFQWLRRARERAAQDPVPAESPQEHGVAPMLAQARACIDAGRAEDALAWTNRLIDAVPELAQAHCLQGIAALQLGRTEDALDALQLAVHYGPNVAQNHRQLARALRTVGRDDEARASLERAAELAPESASILHDLGLARLRGGDSAAAAQAFERALAIAPRNVALLSDFGYVLGRLLAREDEALKALDAALAIDPNHVDAIVNRGVVCQQCGRFDAARADYERALALADVPEARLNRGLLRLMDGEFAHGWSDYEARAAVQARALVTRFPYPRWDGSDLAGRRLLVYGEQGLGDEIMFASCLPDVIARAGSVIFNCSPRLAGLFRRSFPNVVVHGAEQADTDVGWLASLGAPDFVTGIGSLPVYLRQDAANFPAHDGYLRADPIRVAAWRKRLATLGHGRTVGLSWRGGTPTTRGPARSLSVETLLPILKLPGHQFVSVQYGDCRGELDRLAREHGIRLPHFPESVDDLDETAALLCALDEVVSVCTAVIHLAGALGRRAQVLVPSVPEWRYRRSGTTMAWYPAVELVRQSAADPWGRVVERVAARLAGRVNG